MLRNSPDGVGLRRGEEMRIVAGEDRLARDEDGTAGGGVGDLEGRGDFGGGARGGEEFEKMQPFCV